MHWIHREGRGMSMFAILYYGGILEYRRWQASAWLRVKQVLMARLSESSLNLTLVLLSDS